MGLITSFKPYSKLHEVHFVLLQVKKEAKRGDAHWLTSPLPKTICSKPQFQHAIQLSGFKTSRWQQWKDAGWDFLKGVCRSVGFITYTFIVYVHSMKSSLTATHKIKTKLINQPIHNTPDYFVYSLELIIIICWLPWSLAAPLSPWVKVGLDTSTSNISKAHCVSYFLKYDIFSSHRHPHTIIS